MSLVAVVMAVKVIVVGSFFLIAVVVEAVFVSIAHSFVVVLVIIHGGL